jgi:hypothetical protein
MSGTERQGAGWRTVSGRRCMHAIEWRETGGVCKRQQPSATCNGTEGAQLSTYPAHLRVRNDCIVILNHYGENLQAAPVAVSACAHGQASLGPQDLAALTDVVPIVPQSRTHLESGGGGGVGAGGMTGGHVSRGRRKGGAESKSGRSAGAVEAKHVMGPHPHKRTHTSVPTQRVPCHWRGRRQA